MKVIITISLLMLTACGPNKNYPKLPDYSFLLLDSTSIMSTKDIPEGIAFTIMYVSPDCEDCQHQTKALVNNANLIQGQQFYIITSDPFGRMKLYNSVYKLSDHKNITLGYDYSKSFITQFRPPGSPCTFVYDRRKRLRAVLSGELMQDGKSNALRAITLMENLEKE